MKVNMRCATFRYLLVFLACCYVCSGNANGGCALDVHNSSDMQYQFRADVATRYRVEYTVHTLDGDEDQEQYRVRGFLDIQHYDKDERDGRIVDMTCTLVSLSVQGKAVNVHTNEQVRFRTVVSRKGGILFRDGEPEGSLKSCSLPDAYARILRGVVVIFPILPKLWHGAVAKADGEDMWSYTYSVAEPFTITGSNNIGTKENGLFTTVSSRFHQGRIVGGSMNYVRYQDTVQVARGNMSVSTVSVMPRLAIDLTDAQECASSTTVSAVQGGRSTTNNGAAEVTNCSLVQHAGCIHRGNSKKSSSPLPPGIEYDLPKAEMDKLLEKYSPDHPLVRQHRQSK